MKKLIYLLMLAPVLGLSQVGAGTDQPTNVLDVNGDLRIRNIVAGDAQTDHIMVVSQNGAVQNTNKENLSPAPQIIDNKQSAAYDVVVDPNSDPINEVFTASLDLWSDQHLYGVDALQDVYFLGLRQRITLPENITVAGDKKIRKITFVVMQNNSPEGFGNDLTSQAYNRWHIIFQTKKYEINGETGSDCVVNDQTYLYEPHKYSGLFSPDPESAYQSQNNDAAHARLKMQYQNQIRDRAIVFYDFDGKWIVSVRD